MPVVFPDEKPGLKSRAGQKVLKGMNRATAAIRPKARRFWGKPKSFPVSEMQIGDLAFSRFEYKLGEGISSAVTGYPVMHASLYIGNGEFFDLSKRAKIVLPETLRQYYSEPFVFRPTLSARQQEKIVGLARQMVKEKVKRGKNIRGVIGFQRTVGIKAKNPKDKGYLCSNAIAEFFAKAGVDLVPGVHPLRTSSTDLMKSKKLKLLNG